MNNKKVLIALAFFLMGFCFFCSFSIYQIRVRQCLLWTCMPDRAFSVFDLSLPNHLLPDNAVVNPMVIPSDPSGVESGNISFFWQETEGLYGGVLDVDKYGTEMGAKKAFESGLYWRSRGSYKAHTEITYESPFADEFLIGCGSSMFDNGYECSLTARYQEYVVDFNSSIDRQLSESQFEQIVINIDQQMIDFLGRE